MIQRIKKIGWEISQNETNDQGFIVAHDLYNDR